MSEALSHSMVGLEHKNVLILRVICFILELLEFLSLVYSEVWDTACPEVIIQEIPFEAGKLLSNMQNVTCCFKYVSNALLACA